MNIAEVFIRCPTMTTRVSNLQLKNSQKVEVNREQASALELTANQIESTLNDAYGTRQVSAIYTLDDTIR